MAARVLQVAGAVLWVLSAAVLAARQRVLSRRLSRIERLAGRQPRRRGPGPVQAAHGVGPVAVRPEPGRPGLPPPGSAWARAAARAERRAVAAGR